MALLDASGAERSRNILSIRGILQELDIYHHMLIDWFIGDLLAWLVDVVCNVERNETIEEGVTMEVAKKNFYAK